MATVKEVYELLKKKQAAGEKIGMFADSIEAVENEQDTSTTKEVHVSFIKKNLRISSYLILKYPIYLIGLGIKKCCKLMKNHRI